jgi:hypothetical protein
MPPGEQKQQAANILMRYAAFHDYSDNAIDQFLHALR